MKKASFKTTQIIHFQIVTNTMLIAFLSILTFSCTNDDEPPVVVKKEISEEIKTTPFISTFILENANTH